MRRFENEAQIGASWGLVDAQSRTETQQLTKISTIVAGYGNYRTG